MNKFRDAWRRVWLCAITMWLGLAGSAWGAGAKESAQQQATRARKACLSGDYQKGVDILTELFIETKDPVMIFNQGRCFEQSSRYQDAISRFEEYLRITKNTGAKDRGEAKEHIVECQAKLDRMRALAPAPAMAPTAVPAPVVVPETAAPVLASEIPEPDPTPQAEPVSQARGLRTAGIVVGSAGVAALGAAVFLNLKANSMAKDLNSNTGYDRAKVSDRKSYETVAWIGYGVGAACLVGGAVLYGLGLGSGASQVALTPSVASGHAGLSLQGVF
jgi:hypothetical protein